MSAIIFDMESVMVSARFDNVEDLQDFIEKLKKLMLLMCPKSNIKVTDAKIEAAAKAIRDLYESLAPDDATPRQIAKVALEAAAKVEE